MADPAAPPDNRGFDSEPPTDKASFDTEAYAKDRERELCEATRRAHERTIKRGIIASRVASDVDLEWMNLDEDARRFVAEVDGLRSAPKIFAAIGITPDAGYALLERLLVAGVISLRH